MKLAFYRAFQDNATFIDKFIAIGTLSKHSHVENVFSDGMSFSISGRDKYSRFKKIKFSPKNWDIIDIDVTPEEEQRLRERCENRLGIEYDYKGAFFSFYKTWTLTKYLFNGCIENRKTIFCSEESVNMLREETVSYSDFEEGCKYCPGRLLEEIDLRTLNN